MLQKCSREWNKGEKGGREEKERVEGCAYALDTKTLGNERGQSVFFFLKESQTDACKQVVDLIVKKIHFINSNIKESF